MVRRLIILAAGLLILSSAAALAGEVQNVNAVKDFRLDVREADRTADVVKNLTHEVDLWHDAALKRNGKRMRSHEKRIFSLIESDIKARDRVIYRYENEAGSSVRNAVKSDGTDLTVPRHERVEARDDMKDVRKAKQLVKAKQLLFDSIKRTDVFSNRYRLLGDYLEIVRRENQMNRVEIAEDVKEVRKN